MKKEFDLKVDGADVHISIEGPLKHGPQHAPHVLFRTVCGETTREGTFSISGETMNYSKEKFIEELNKRIAIKAKEAVGHERGSMMITEHLSS